MGPLKAAAARVNGERFCHGPGEDLETHRVANPAGELEIGGAALPLGSGFWLIAVRWPEDARRVAPHTGGIAAFVTRASCFGGAAHADVLDRMSKSSPP